MLLPYCTPISFMYISARIIVRVEIPGKKWRRIAGSRCEDTDICVSAGGNEDKLHTQLLRLHVVLGPLTRITLLMKP